MWAEHIIMGMEIWALYIINTFCALTLALIRPHANSTILATQQTTLTFRTEINGKKVTTREKTCVSLQSTFLFRFSCAKCVQHITATAAPFAQFHDDHNLAMRGKKGEGGREILHRNHHAKANNFFPIHPRTHTLPPLSQLVVHTPSVVYMKKLRYVDFHVPTSRLETTTTWLLCFILDKM